MDQHAVVQHLVCKPSKRNITGIPRFFSSPSDLSSCLFPVIFGPVREFIKEMEVAMCLHR